MPKTIMLIHGAWVTPTCWTSFESFFASRGYRVIAPPWPYMERPVEDLRRSPDPRMKDLTIKALVDHFEAHIRALPETPILMGHSFGGLIVQMLLDRGLGASGVAFDAGPPRGVLPSLTATMAAAPVLLAWNGWNRILTMSFKSFSKTFANTLAPAEQRPAYDKYIVPAPGRIYFQAAFGIGNAVNFKNPKRPPLLLVAAAQDRTSTPSMVRAMFKKHSRAPSRTDIIEFPNRSHWLIAEPGWQDVASSAIEWAESLGAATNPNRTPA
jgi:pimeloyl-ACP methyl ester carboxylesterase